MFALGDALKRCSNVGRPVHTRRVTAGPHEHEIIVHHGVAGNAETVGNELALGGGMMDQQHIRIAIGREPDCLPGADGDHPDLYARCRHELRQQVIEQARILRGRRRRDGDRPRLGTRSPRAEHDAGNEHDERSRCSRHWLFLGHGIFPAGCSGLIEQFPGQEAGR